MVSIQQGWRKHDRGFDFGVVKDEADNWLGHVAAEAVFERQKILRRAKQPHNKRFFFERGTTRVRDGQGFVAAAIARIQRC